MHELLRQYGDGRLRKSQAEHAETYDRYSQCFGEMLENIEGEITTVGEFKDTRPTIDAGLRPQWVDEQGLVGGLSVTMHGGFDSQQLVGTAATLSVAFQENKTAPRDFSRHCVMAPRRGLEPRT